MSRLGSTSSTEAVRRRQCLPPDRRSFGVGPPPAPQVHVLGNRCRLTLEEPDLTGTWLVQIAGTTADHTVFPPDRTLPSLGFDFRELDLRGEEPPDPFAPFRELIGSGLRAAFAGRRPKHIVFVGHSFGAMAAMDFLLVEGREALRTLVPGVEQVTAVMVCAAHRSPMDRYSVRSDAPVVGSALTWLSRHLTRLATTDRARLEQFARLCGQKPPRPLWREHWGSRDELGGFWDMPTAASVDHFWSVVRCAKEYDLRPMLEARRVWFDVLVLSAERDASWPEDMFPELWGLLLRSGCRKARWCRFPGDDHLGVVRQPTKYYKEIKDFLLAGRMLRPASALA